MQKLALRKADKIASAGCQESLTMPYSADGNSVQLLGSRFPCAGVTEKIMVGVAGFVMDLTVVRHVDVD
ncbi:MAG: hypothetical protein DMG68_09430 [Acidobacteria bacterium]|nr:MAG: hypothetical protein DMG68_09430 [Acidobacteriota bacterium]